MEKIVKNILFIQSQDSWVNNLKKLFNGNYSEAQFDFRRTPRAALGRFIWGLKYDIILIEYGWSIDGLRKQIQELSPKSAVYTYSQLQCQPNNCNKLSLIKKDVNSFKQVLRENGVVSNDKHK